MRNKRSMLVCILKFESFLFCLFSCAAGLACPSLQAGAGGSRLQKSPAAQVLPMDINHADLEELATLPGVGPALVQRIIACRNEKGPFQEPEGLKAVKGIGHGKFEKLRPLIRIQEGFSLSGS